MARLQAQLDTLIKTQAAQVSVLKPAIDLSQNKTFLKLLELQPAGKSAPSNLGFPNSKEDYDFLKSLGHDRAFQMLTLYHKNQNPHTTFGAELIFKNGKTILLGVKETKEVSTMNFSKPPASVKVSQLKKDNSGDWRFLYFLDSSGSQIGGSCDTYVYNPLFKETTETLKQIPAAHDIIGVSLTTNADGHIVWMNLLLFPQHQQIY